MEKTDNELYLESVRDSQSKELTRLQIENADLKAKLFSANEINIKYIHIITELETNCDPAGNIRVIASQQEQIDGLLEKLREAELTGG